MSADGCWRRSCRRASASRFMSRTRPAPAAISEWATRRCAAPDGHTMVFVSTSYVFNPSLYPKLPYDPIKDFAPVTLTGLSPNVLVVHPSIHATNVKELIAFLKANPAKYSIAHAG